MKFRFRQLSEKPVLDAAPNHIRMTTCYLDANGTYHLVTDYIPSALGTWHSWQASLRYYTSHDFSNWEDHGNVLERDELSSGENFGVASPHLLWVDGRALLFYAGRSVENLSQESSPFATRGTKGYIGNKIFLAEAAVDSKGRIIGPFTRKGLVLDNTKDWNNMRIDDPCVLKVHDKMRIYFKGFSELTPARDGIDLGVSECSFGKIDFPEPGSSILGVNGGGEMPRVFRIDDQWHMFYRHFSPRSDESHWQHYISEDGLQWKLNDPNLFNCAGSEPVKGATDLMFVYGKDGIVGTRFKVLACGAEEDVLKLWGYEVNYEY